MAADGVRAVSAWACGQCEHVHLARTDADACCRCDKCGNKFNRGSTWRSLCERCSWGLDVRAARAAVRRAREVLQSAESTLAHWLKSKPAKAKAA